MERDYSASFCKNFSIGLLSVIVWMLGLKHVPKEEQNLYIEGDMQNLNSSIQINKYSTFQKKFSCLFSCCHTRHGSIIFIWSV